MIQQFYDNVVVLARSKDKVNRGRKLGVISYEVKSYCLCEPDGSQAKQSQNLLSYRDCFVISLCFIPRKDEFIDN